jgi:hypothetical protein
MKNICYWVPEKDDDNKLVYLLAYANREPREASWKVFVNDPERKAVYAKSIEEGHLVIKIDSTFI